MKSRNRNNGSLVVISLLSVVNLLLLLALKYFLNSLSLSEFRIDYIGNVLNVIISFLFLLGIVVCILRKRVIDKRRISLIISLQIITLFSLGLVVLLEKTDMLNLSGYLFNFPVKKVYTGFLFVLGELTQIYLLVYIWGLAFLQESLFEIRSLVRTAGAVVILMIFSLIYVWNVRAYEKEKLPSVKYEYGCIPGAAVWGRGRPSPLFEGRIRKALELIREKRIDKLILTGGHAPGEISESESAFKYLANLDVPKNKMILETESSTTTEQIKFIRKHFNPELQTNNQIIMISDGFHLSRVTQIAKFFRVNSLGVASDYSLSISKTLFYRARESVALLLFWFFAI